MIPEVGGLGLGGPRGKGSRSVSKGPKAKTTYTTIAIAEKQPKTSNKGPFRYMYNGSPGSTQELELMGPGGKVPPGPPGFSSHERMPLQIFVGEIRVCAPLVCSLHLSSQQRFDVTLILERVSSETETAVTKTCQCPRTPSRND